jgi:hypothetical protein
LTFVDRKSVLEKTITTVKKLKSIFFILAITTASIILNLYFIWTSWAYQNSSALFHHIQNFAAFQMNLFLLGPYFTQVASSACNNPIFSEPYCSINSLTVRFFVDCETLALAVAVFFLSFLLSQARNKMTIALARAFQITSGVALPLGIEI